MKKWIFATIAFTILTVFSPVWAANNNSEQQAKAVIENWFAAMKNHEVEKAGSYLAPEFVSIHTDGMVRNKSQEIELIKNLDMTSYHLTDFHFSQSENTIVVTYKDTGAENIDNEKIGANAAGRMAVLQKKRNDKWIIIAYANLDKIG